MKNLTRLVLLLSALSFGSFAFAGEKKECPKSEKDCAKCEKDCSKSEKSSKEECEKCKAEKK